MTNCIAPSKRFLLGFLFALASACLGSAAEPFFFIQLSDPQFGMYTTNRDFVQETANFEFAVATINRLRPAFVVITGDLVNKAADSGQIKEFKRIAAKIDSAIPVYRVAGNHDVETIRRQKQLRLTRMSLGRIIMCFATDILSEWCSIRR